MEPEDNVLNASTEELEKAREILGDAVKNLSDQELQKIITQFDHLADLWMEDYERSIFDGKTLDDLVNAN